MTQETPLGGQAGAPQPLPVVQPVKPIRRRGCLFWLFAFLAVVVLPICIVIIIGFVGALGSTLDTSIGPAEEVVRDEGGKEKIVIVSVSGIITEQSVFMSGVVPIKEIADQLKQAREDDAVRAVILEVNSPGGGMTASDILHRQITKTKDEGKKIVVLMTNTATSGAYYLSAPADYIMAHPTTITGSIGVLISSLNMEGLFQKIGLKDVTIKSGDKKDLLSPFRTMTEEERALLQGIVDEMYERFLKVVAQGRGMNIQKVRRLADGRIFTARTAKKAGLIDGIGYLEDAIDRAKGLSGITKAKVVRYKKRWRLLEFMRRGAKKEPFDIRCLVWPGTPQPLYLWNVSEVAYLKANRLGSE